MTRSRLVAGALCLVVATLTACSSSSTAPAGSAGVTSATATAAMTAAPVATVTPPVTTAATPPTATTPATATTTASVTAAAAIPPSGPVDMTVVRKACAAPCSERYTTIQVYRDERGAVRRYERPSMAGSCSHAPTLFFDERGGDSGAIPLVPVVPGSEQARKFDAIREQQTAGLHRAEAVPCAKP